MRFEGGYAGNDFSVLDVYLNEKTQAVKIHSLNIFKDHHIVAELDPTTIDYDGWSLWMDGLMTSGENFTVIMVNITLN